MQQNLVITFEFENESTKIDTTLNLVRDRIFEEPEVELVISYQNQNQQTVKQLLHYCHLMEEDPIEENSCNIQIPEVEGKMEVQAPNLDSEYYAAPLKIKKVNIGPTKNPNIARIRDYWDNEIV